MHTDPNNIRKRLKDFDLTTLLIEELGWNCHAAQPLIVVAGGAEFVLKAIAEKCGMVVYVCSPSADGAPPPYPLRRKIEQQVRKTAHEHLIVFADAKQTIQIWQWVKRQVGSGAACREHTYRTGQTGQALVEKLQGLVFELEEEERLTITDVTARTRSALDVERVTKRFYDRFKKEHLAFLKFIQGIDERTDRDWYASLMLNRMMFVYFIQKRGFLDGDAEYLRNRLAMIQAHRGKGRFLSFYRYFLLRLFHEGLGQPAKNRAKDLDPLLGRVPYLNGGLFDVHELEREYSGIDIPDEAFQGIFDFFDSYTWHLDERPLRADNEINPDVLGYIFEKFINQKQMGAYYTKEDITGYIGRNTIIPHLFDAAQRDCPIAFKPGGGVWRLLKDDPDGYIYPAVRSGVIELSSTSSFTPHPSSLIPESVLPEFVREGMHDPQKRMFNKQYNLGQAHIPGPNGENLALPTETWREYAERRKRCIELREKLAAGDVQAINDFITLNLDIEQFAEDVIVNSEGPELVRAFWKALTRISILDPTCGSGAFLFAALNILEPLYNACLDGMQGFLEDLERSERKHSPKKLSDFRQVLDEMAKHPNRRYFVLKSIVINNLYGVDIMDEAVEICKLRLFLKLVAQVEKVEQIEPLPDIDFNIRAGNTLVGFTSLDAVRDAMTTLPDGQHRLVYEEDEAALKRIEEDAELADRQFQFFHEMQTKHDMDAAEFTNAKAEVRRRLDSLRDELDRHLAREYGVKVEERGEFDKWRASHKPFHWLVEFYGIVQAGGFGVIIGNPPYVEYSKVRKEYAVRNYHTEGCGNLYALCTERAISLQSCNGFFGFIVQAPVVSTNRMESVRRVLIDNARMLAVSTFDDRPSKLFEGMHHCRVAILIASLHKEPDSKATLLTTRYHKWYKEERDRLFHSVSYLKIEEPMDGLIIPKFRSEKELYAWDKVRGMSFSLGHMMAGCTGDARIFYKITGVGHWFTFTTRPPRFWRDGVESNSTRENSVAFANPECRDTAFCCLCSSLHYWLYQAKTNCRDFNPADIKFLPVPKSLIHGLSEFVPIREEITNNLEKHSEIGTGDYSVGGNIQYQKFRPGLAKSLFDEVDVLLAPLYGFTDVELDFVINYDIKYRMGQELTGEDDSNGEEGTADNGD